MSDNATDKQIEIVEQAFAEIDFYDVEIVDKLRDISIESESEKLCHLRGTAFGKNLSEADEHSDSFIVSFHCVIDDSSRVHEAYAYDTRTGNEIARLEKNEQNQ